MKYLNKLKNIVIVTKSKKSSRAFTLLETMIAVSILLLSIVGPMTIASKGLQSAIYARDEITAFYLAQEAIEYVRMVRDSSTISDCYGANTTDCLDKDKWLAGLNDCILNANNEIIGNIALSYCSIDATKSLGSGILLSENIPLNLNSTTYQYSYDTASSDIPSKFTRNVRITKFLNGWAKINVKVTWIGALLATPKTFEINGYISNQR